MSARIRALLFALAIALPAIVMASPATQAGAPSASTAKQLHDADTALQRQRAQSAQWHARVTELEKQSAADRRRQAQRDRQIAELQRQLDAQQAGEGRVPIKPAVTTGGY